MSEKQPRKKKEKPKGEYRNLLKINGIWTFEVKTKTQGWLPLAGLSGEVSRVDAEKFAQNTAEGWKKK